MIDGENFCCSFCMGVLHFVGKGVMDLKGSRGLPITSFHLSFLRIERWSLP